MKKQKGITLIALIITIIIMLILAGVVINLTIGKNGIFKIAKQAVKNYTDAEAKELANLNNITNIVDQTINSEIGGTKPSIPDTPTTTTGVNSLKPGDYIKYNSGANGEILCRVLYPVSSEYGLQIISDKNVKNVTLGSTTYSETVELYNNAIEILNNEAEAYINTEYAYDSRCVGSLPTIQNGMFIEKDNGATTYATLPFTAPGYIKSLDSDTNYEIDKAQMKAGGINLWFTGEGYWLASRAIDVDTDMKHICFCLRNAKNDIDNSEATSWPYVLMALGYPSWNGYSRELGLRPCISLKSNIIKITSGDGKSADTAYVIEK